MRVPKLVGLMAEDAREEASLHGLVLEAPSRPDFLDLITDYVVRQIPLPGAEVPWGSPVVVWFDFGEGEGEGGAGVREPRTPKPPSGGMRREIPEPEPGASGEWVIPAH